MLQRRRGPLTRRPLSSSQFSESAYAATFRGDEAVQAHQDKFLHPIDRIRHDVELEFLRKYAVGSLFDCTVGFGRFIGSLPRVTDYRGIDLSPELVSQVRSTFMMAAVAVADLTLGIPHESNIFDTVMCLRSLSTIGHLSTILPEMMRVAKPGGHVVMDYGCRRSTICIEGLTVVVDDEPLDDVLADLPADLVEEVRCDGLLCYAKQNYLIYRLLGASIGKLIPKKILIGCERASLPWLGQRRLIAIRKRPQSLVA